MLLIFLPPLWRSSVLTGPTPDPTAPHCHSSGFLLCLHSVRMVLPNPQASNTIWMLMTLKVRSPALSSALDSELADPPRTLHMEGWWVCAFYDQFATQLVWEPCCVYTYYVQVIDMGIVGSTEIPSFKDLTASGQFDWARPLISTLKQTER